MIIFPILALTLITYTIVKQINDLFRNGDRNGNDRVRYIMILGLFALALMVLCFVFGWKHFGYVLCLIKAINWSLLYLEGDWRVIVKLPWVLIKRLWIWIRK